MIFSANNNDRFAPNGDEMFDQRVDGFSRADVNQESQYTFPYHYIPSFENGQFSQHLYWSWGLHYICAQEKILDVLGQEPFESLVDVGCGDGRLLREIHRRFPKKELLGVDSSKRAIDLACALNPGLDYRQIDICTNKTQLELFDVVTLVEVLEHISPESIDIFVKAFARLNKSGGRILMTVPHKNKQVQEKHFQHFDSSTLRKTLENYYDIECLIYIDKLSRFLKYFVYPLLANRFFILNNQYVLDVLYAFYRKYLFFANEKNCGRIFLIGRRK